MSENPKIDDVDCFQRLLFDAELTASGGKKGALIGLALSGGGIRSATFCLGVAQSLAKHGLLRHFDYLSSVSGGGFLASFIHRLRKERGQDVWQEELIPKTDAQKDANPSISHIRRYSNYLNPNKSLLSGDTAGSLGAWARNVFLIQLQLAFFLFAVILAAYAVLDAAYWYSTEVHDTQRRLISGSFAFLGLLTFGISHQRLLADKYDEQAQSIFWVQASSFSFALAAIFSALGLISVALHNSLPAWWYYVGMTVALYVLAEILSVPLGAFSKKDLFKRRFRDYGISLLGAFLGSALGGVLLWISNSALVYFGNRVCTAAGNLADSIFLLGVIFGPPIVMLCILAAACLQLGIMSFSDRGIEVQQRLRTDVIREYWARIGGRGLMIMVFLWPAASALILLSSWMMANLQQNWLAVAGWLGSTAGALVLGGGSKTSDMAAGNSRWREYLTMLLPYVFAFGLLALISIGCARGLAMIVSVNEAVPGSFSGYAAWLVRLLSALHGERILLLVAALGFFWFLLSAMIDINEFGQTKLYQLRIVRAYQAAARPQRAAEPITNFDPQDDVCLAAIAQRPYPLINCAMNLVQSDDANLDWQDRKAANYVLSPLFCGFLPGRFNRCIVGDSNPGVSKTANTLSLGAAVAISGAAANPNMGYHSSPAVTFLLTIFNVRLGWWLANERKQPDLKPKRLGWHLIMEMFGRTSDKGHLVNLSDGGHFENLAVYELLRRQVRLIIACDVGADPGYQYEDLAGLVRKARIDLNIEIELRSDAKLPNKLADADKPYAAFEIRYPQGEPGVLILIKPCKLAGVSLDVENYASANPQFPQQGTSDQFFDEAQFESYRKLGRHIGEKLCTDLASTTGSSNAPAQATEAEALIQAANWL